jgi:hypothetical protein
VDRYGHAGIGELELSRFAISGGGELENARLLVELRSRFPESEARGVFDDLVWIDDPSAPTTIAPEEKTFHDRDRIERFAPEQMALLDRFPTAFRAAAEERRVERATFQRLAARLPIPAPASHAATRSSSQAAWPPADVPSCSAARDRPPFRTSSGRSASTPARWIPMGSPSRDARHLHGTDLTPRVHDHLGGRRRHRRSRR